MNRMVFRNYGGNYQLRLENAGDLALIQDLKVARWAATSVQTDSLQCDPVFLKCLNPDGSGRIRPQHLRAAVKWLFHMIADCSRLAVPSDVLLMEDLDTSHDEGRKLKDAALHILEQLKAETSDRISLEQIRTFRDTYMLASPNGDGVLPPNQVSDPDVARLVTDVLRNVGAVKDLSGADGINEGHLSEFLDHGKEFLAWKVRGEGNSSTHILPWGDETPAAAKLVAELDVKIEQFFSLCDLVKVDARTAERIRLSEQDLENLDFSDPRAIEKKLMEAPLQTPNPEGILNFEDAINPYYQGKMDQLRHQVLARAPSGLMERFERTAWEKVRAIFEPYWVWQAEKPPGGMDRLDEPTLREYLNGPAKETLRQLLLEDLSVQGEVKQINSLEKLTLYRCCLLELANNCVNLSAFYSSDQRALFEIGDLIIDGRQLTFTVKVQNHTEHKKVAATSRLFLVYAKIAKCGDQEQGFEIAAAVTAGNKGGIEIGKRGVFYDLQGEEWDAQVVDILENPISVWEAIKAPFVRVKDLVARKAESFAGTQVQQFDTTSTAITTKMEKGGSFQQPAGGSAPAATTGIRDLLLGGGIAFAAISSSLAYLIKTLSQVSLLKVGLWLVVTMLAVMLFSALLGWNKLRKRDLSAVLEACGWAVNFRMYLTHKLGHLVTRTPPLPKGAQVEHRDLVRLSLRKSGYRTFNWARLGLVSLLTVLSTAVVLSLFFGNEVKSFLRTWLGLE